MKRLWQVIKRHWNGLIHGQLLEITLAPSKRVAPAIWTCPACGGEWYPDDVGWEGMLPGGIGTMRCYCEFTFDVEMEEVSLG